MTGHNLNKNNYREQKVPIAGQATGGAMPALLDGNNTCTVQTYTNSAGAKAKPLQPDGHEEQVPTFASHRVSKTDSRQIPTERERLAVLGAIKLHVAVS